MHFFYLIICLCALVWSAAAELSGSWSLSDVNNLVKSMKLVIEKSTNPRDLFFAVRFLQKFPEAKHFDCGRLKLVESQSLSFLDWHYFLSVSDSFGCSLNLPARIQTEVSSSEPMVCALFLSF
jgi:hypothetical protein